MLTLVHIIGILLTVGLLVAVSIYSGREVRDAKSFTTGGNSGSWMVCGAIMGTLVGGQSTIGTAQLAFSYGLSAWWFTLGAALGAVVLALVYAKPLRQSGCTTLTEIVSRQYGRKAETIGSLLSLIGIFISIVAQVLASSAMMTSLFSMPELLAAILSAALILLFVLFGGIRSAGAGGIVKMVLLYVSSLVAGIIVFAHGGGLSGVKESVATLFQTDGLSSFCGIASTSDLSHRFSSLFARGPFKDLGSCLSLVLGVVCTQTYAQGIWSARTTAKAKQGALLCAFLIPVIGAACTLVGLYMRGHYVTMEEYEYLQSMGVTLPQGLGVLQNSAQAFPTFILNELPSWMGGVLLGTLFVTILGGGSGLALGAATIMVRDVYGNFGLKREDTGIYRLTIFFLLLVAVVAASGFKGAFINDLGFLSLGLRATAILFPLTLALFRPGSLSPKAARLSMISGTLAMLVAKMVSLPGDPVYWGLLVGYSIILIDRLLRREASITK